MWTQRDLDGLTFEQIRDLQDRACQSRDSAADDEDWDRWRYWDTWLSTLTELYRDRAQRGES